MDFIKETIKKLEDKIKSSVGMIAEQLSSFISSIINGIKDGLQAVWDHLTGFVRDVGSWIKENLEDIYSNVLAIVSRIVSNLKDTIGNLVDTVKSSLTKVITTLSDKISEVYNSVKEGIQTAIKKVGEWIGNSYNAVKTWIGNTVESIGEWLGGVYNNVKEGIQTTIENVGKWVGGAVDSVKEAYSSLETTVRDWLAKQLEKLVGLVEEIGKRFQTFKEWLAEEVLSPAAKWIGEASEWSQNFIGALESGFVDPVISNPDMPSALKMLLNSSTVSKHLLLAAVGMFAIPAMIPMVMNTIYSPQFDKVAQSAQAEFRSALLQPNQLVEGFHRGILGFDTLHNEFSRHGFTDPDINTMLTLYNRYIGIGDELALWRRGILSEAELYTDLKQQGFTDQRIEYLQKASEYIPNVPDLIRMAVRDVWSPDIAEKGQIFTDFPEAFGSWAEKLGLSEEWALNYWGAHWELPSPQMGFEMLHRGIIDEEDLRNLLKAADYAPGWRDPLIAISYNPLTRVDIRRMHKLGILDREQVKQSYKDLGYDEEKAEWLTVFTEKLNAVEAKTETVSNRELTRSQVERAYVTGMIDRETSYTLLSAIGYDDFEVEFILTMKDWEAAADIRDRKVETIQNRYLSGHLTTEEVWDELGKLGLTYIELEKSWDEITAKSIIQPKSPTLADLQKAYKKKLITYEEFEIDAKRLGYSQKWVEIYAKLA